MITHHLNAEREISVVNVCGEICLIEKIKENCCEKCFSISILAGSNISHLLPYKDASTINDKTQLLSSPFYSFSLDIMQSSFTEAINDGRAATLWQISAQDGVSISRIMPSQICNCPRTSSSAQFSSKTPIGPRYKATRRFTALELHENIVEYMRGPLKIFTKPLDDVDLGIPAAVARLELQGIPSITLLGRSDNILEARAIASLEAVERYVGLFPGADPSVRVSNFKSLKSPALDPSSVGLHLPGHPQYPDYHSDLIIDWVLAESRKRGGPIYIPTSFAFYGGNQFSPQVRLAFETSNGCALGSSVEEASLHAILELVERDAFLAAWYRAEALPDVTEQACHESLIAAYIAKIAACFKMTVHILVSTQEHQIPSVVLLAKGEGILRCAISAGVGESIIAAAKAAFPELLGHLSYLSRVLSSDAGYGRALWLSENPDRVSSMEDHGMANCLHSSSGPVLGLIGSKTNSYDLHKSIFDKCGDPADCLRRVMNMIESVGMEVITYTQKSRLLDECNLFSVKAIVPGLVPLTFGHTNRRLFNLSRLGGDIGMKEILTRPNHPFM